VDSPACNLYNIRSYFEGGNKGRVSAVGREVFNKGYVIVDVAGEWDCECGCAESAGAGEV
jgi:hypothetical protein